MKFHEYIQDLWKSKTIEQFRIVQLFYMYYYWILGLFFPIFNIQKLIKINIFKIILLMIYRFT